MRSNIQLKENAKKDVTRIKALQGGNVAKI